MEGAKMKSEDLWTPFVKFQRIIENILRDTSESAILRLEDCLRKHKQNFLALLKNSPKNASYREELNRGVTTGISIPGIGHQILSKEIVQETMIISDMYDLNEYMALDLLCTAQIQMPNYPGLTRGLVAVLLYYDGRKALVSTLRTLVEVRSGNLWMAEISVQMIKHVTQYLDQLMNDGLFDRIFELLNSLDLSKEIEFLQKNRALGGPRHHRQILDLFEDIRQELADIIFLWSAQTGLPREPTIRLINHLKLAKLQDDPTGGIDNNTLTLQMALLYAVDMSIIQRNEDDEETVKKLPIMSDPKFIEAVANELSPEKPKWNCEGLQSLSMFAWGLCLATMRQSNFTESTRITDTAEFLVDAAIQMKVFDFLHRIFLNNDMIYKEQFYMKRIHSLLTDFIVLMHSKVKDLRIRAEETARTIQVYIQEGLDAPASLPHDYEHLLFTISKLYSKDPLNLKLILEYWSSVDNTSAVHRSSQRAISLFKFVRQAGELLPPTLFVPYLKMLASLSSHPQAARHTFNFLKQNGPGNTSTVSWDHFFNSLNQYYVNLRIEAVPAADTIYTHRNHPRGIFPLEIQGMHGVLLLIKTVAEYDEFSRIALCEYPSWAPLNVLLGLVSCSVPIPLKADLLNTLAALAKSPETAVQMWNNLEASQILITIPSTSSYQPRGVQTELEEIESKMEEYPLTRALLNLLDSLTTSGIPRSLGAGTRKPGFDPYLNFIINSVFLKFNARAYKNQEEKWKIADTCLKLFCKFLQQYDPTPNDFPNQNQPLEMNPHPGFHLMLQLSSKSDFLQLVLLIIDEGVQFFDTYTTFSGKKQLEKTTLSCLKLLDNVFQHQERFYNLMINSGYATLQTKLAKLLMGMNQRSGIPDHMLKIAKYVTYSSWLQEHSLLAVKILLHVTETSTVNSQLVSLFTSDNNLSSEIIIGFVECLQSNEYSLDSADEATNISTSIKLNIFKLLKQCLAQSYPNLSHYLFGFDLKDIKKTVFQQPGVLGFPRTCLHSLFTILNDFIRHSFTDFKSNSAVIESAYSVLYLLCANPQTSEPVLRFIRSNHEFLERQIGNLPSGTKCDAVTLNQLSWLLKTIAIEIKISSDNNHLSQLTTLVNLLLGSIQKQEKLTDAGLTFTDSENSDQSSSRLKNLLGNVNLSRAEEQLPLPHWDFFDNMLMEKLLQNCENTVGGIRLIDIKKLHRVLMDELSTLQGSTAASQKQMIVKEIEKVLMYAIKYNNLRNESAASVRYMEAWRQMAEVLFLTVPQEVLSLELRQIVLLDLIHSLLFKFIPTQIPTEVSSIISAATLQLFVCLRKSYLAEQKQLAISADEDRIKKITLFSNRGLLQNILHKLVEWITVSAVSAQKVRVNLYGALLHFMRILNNTDADEIDPAPVNDSNYVSRLDNSKYRLGSDLDIKLSFEHLFSFGEKLLVILCHDCTEGHDVARMLALSTVDTLVEVDRNNTTIAFLSRRGYIKHIINSLLQSDEHLREILELTPDTLRPLYLYESKMAMLVRIAMCRYGAEILLEEKCLACLSTMKVYDYHPEISRVLSTEDIEFIPSIESRYQQILFPALNLCDSILTSLGAENQSAVIHVLHFVFSHSETIEMVLRASSPVLSAGCLKEVALLTGIIARTTSHNINDILQNSCSFEDNSAYLHRIQKLMLSLFSRFLLTDNVIRDSPLTSNEKSVQKSDRLLNCLLINCNLILYVRNSIVGNGIDHRSAKVIFPPVLSDSLTSDYRYQYNNVGDQTPGLGVIIRQLLQCIQYYDKEKLTLDFLSRKVKAIPHMNSNDLKEFVPITTEKFNILDYRMKAYEKLSNQLDSKKQEMKYCNFLIENCLYIVWAHLDHYMLRAIPRSNIPRYSQNNTLSINLSTASEAAWKVSIEDISNLKQELTSIFNERFCTQLVSITEDQTKSNKGYVEVLLRRIKRLIQFVPVH